MKNKVITIDTSGIFFPTVKVVNRLKQQRAETGSPSFILPPRVMYFNSILSCLKKINITQDDIVIMAGEGKSWRKEVLASYKAQRKAGRDKDTFTDWDYEFAQLNDLHEQLDNSTNWHFIRVADGLEADDILAISARFFKDNEVIVVTGDCDLHQLAYYPNVKIFNVNKKVKGSKGMWEIISNPLKILADKAKKGDVADNIIPSIDDTEEDYALRHKVVNLLELPKEIEERGIDAIKEAISKNKKLKLDCLPPFKNCKQKFLQIYNPEHKLDYEYCQRLIEKRKERAKQKRKEKK